MAVCAVGKALQTSQTNLIAEFSTDHIPVIIDKNEKKTGKVLSIVFNIACNIKLLYQ